MGRKGPMTALVRNEFKRKSKITVTEICDALEKHPDIKLDRRKLRHRIESIIYRLKKDGEIKNVGVGIYQKC